MTKTLTNKDLGNFNELNDLSQFKQNRAKAKATTTKIRINKSHNQTCIKKKYNTKTE